jgi:hypothetical protein
MITWIQLWPLLGLPSFAIGVLTALPTVDAFGRVLGGGVLREWLLNHVALPLLPDAISISLVRWFEHATVIQEWGLAMLIALHINVALLPLLYFTGEAILRLNNWFTTTDLQLKRKAARR